MSETRRTAYILAGGRSSRFGSDKAEYRRGGARMLDLVADSVRDAVDEIVVVRAPDQDAVVGYRNIRDEDSDRGPLAGVAAALRDASDHASLAVTVGCDRLGIRPEWVDLLVLSLGTKSAAAFRGERWSSDFAVWDPVVAGEVLARSRSDERSVFATLEQLASPLDPPIGWSNTVRANTPAEANRYLDAWLPLRDVQVERGAERKQDLVAVEEPLEIRLESVVRGRRQTRPVSITMRTPGDDASLAVGFLFTEGIIESARDVAGVSHCDDGANPNVINVRLADSVEVDFARLQRNFYTTSSCGVCGKTSIEALEVVADPVETLELNPAVVLELPRRLRATQALFESTGGTHGAGLFNRDGELEAVAEDVGRHNAMDKLVGGQLANGQDCSGRAVCLSGRASFELLQKALVARAGAVVAVGAPSSLAVELAKKNGIALYGFVRDAAFNRYA